MNPRTSTSVVRTEVISPDLERLESLVAVFTEKAEKMMVDDHKKIDLVYDFLFLGQPSADPPVPPFVSMVHASLNSHGDELKKIRAIGSRLLWSAAGTLGGLLLSGVIWFISQTLPLLLNK